MKTVLVLFSAISAFGQVATPLVVTPGSGTASSEIRLRERRSNGDNYVSLRSPASLSANITNILPSDYGSAGQAILTDGAGTWSWGTVSGSSIPVCASATGNDTYTCTISGFTSYTANSCVILSTDTNNTGAATVDISGVGVQNIYRYGGSALSTNDIIANSPVLICYDGTDYQLPPSASAGSGAWLNGGNSFGATSSIGNNDNYDLQVKTNNVVRLTISAGGDAAFTGTVSAPNFDGAPALGTGNYVKTRKLDVADASGGTSFWDLQSNSTAAESSIFARDNSGSRWLKGYRTDLSSPVNFTYVFSDWLPAKRDTTAGDAVNDSDFPSLGSTTRRWLKVWSADADVNGTATIGALTVTGNAGLGGNLSFSGNATPLFDGLGSIGTASYRYGAMFTYDLNASGDITFPTGAATGYVWTSVDGTGLGYWASPAAVLPVVDTTSIVKGSGDATKLLRFEVDGFTTATTRVLTPQDADYTLAGINIAQTFSATQTFGANILFGSDNTYDVGAIATRARAMYSRIFDTAASAVTGDYVQTRKLNIYDNTGSTTAATFWDLQCVVNGVGVLQESYCYMRDNGGSKVFQAERVRTGSAVDRTLWYTDLLPDTNLGQNLGSASNIWSTIYVDAIGTDLFPTADNAKVLGNGTKRWASIRTVDLRADGAITFPSGAVNGYLWTSDASGVGSWQAPTAGLPVIDTTGIAKGSSDPTKILRFEVDGFSTASTRVLTPQNANYTIAGTDLAQTFSAAQTFSSTLNAANGLTVAGTLVISSGRDLANITSVAQNWVPNLSTYDLGSSSTRWSKLWASTFDFSGGGTVTGNIVLSGSSNTMSGTLAPGFDGLGSIGSSSFRYGNVYAYTFNAYTAYAMNGTTVINSSRNLVGLNAIGQTLTFAASSTYNIGSFGSRLLDLHTNYVDLYTDLTFNSGSTFTGNFVPSTNNFYSIGSSAFKLAALYTQNAFFYGSIQAPSGSLGATTTFSVQNSAGSGSCSITVSGGLITSTTC